MLTLDEGSFRLEQTNALGGVNIDPIGKDRSNRACFRLKLRLDRMTPEDIRQVEVKVLGGNVVLMKREVASGGNGLILEMTARPGTRFYIKHPSLGESNTVTINPETDKVHLMDGWADQKMTVVVSCAKAGADVWLDGVYRGKTGADMTLSVKDVMAGPHTVKIQSGEDTAEQQIEVTSDKVYFNIELKSAAHLQQFVVFNVTPADALVEFNGEMLFVTDGMAQKLVRFGTYTYKVIAKDYHPAEGRITVDDVNQKKVVNVSLKPAFGWIDISGSSVDGAIVYIDDKMVGKAPLKSEKIASGVHNVKIVKQMYRNYESSVTVTDGAVAELRPVLAADFETVTLTTDADSEIWINEQQRGTGSWTGDLGTGSYIVECRKPNHRTTSETITVSPGMSVTKISLKSPQPIYGVLSIMSAPGNAEAWLDGKNIGLTPIYLPQILIGSHTLKLTKSGCADWTGNVNVAEGQIAEINATLQSGAPVTFTSNVAGAQLYLDGALVKHEETIDYDATDTAEEANKLITKVYMQKGNTALWANDMAGAIAAYTKVVELDPTNGNAYLRIGRAYAASGKLEEAVAAYETAATNGKEADAKKQLSNLFLKKAQASLKAGANQEVIDYALKANSYLENANAYKLAASAAQHLKNNAQCIEFHEKYLEIKPNAKDAAGVTFTIAALYQQLGNNAKAIENYEKVASDPQYGAGAQEQLKVLKK